MPAAKSVFDYACDELRKKCQRIRKKSSIYQPTITIDLDLCEMLLEDHYDLLRLKEEGD